MFVAITGERADGHDYAAAEVAAGAVCVLASRPVGVPAVLGEMAELGGMSRQAHEEAGRLAAGLGIDILVAVGGADASAVAAAASGGGLLSAVVVPDVGAALSALRDLLRPGDVVLAKEASHAMRLEKLAAALAAAGGPAS